MARSRCSLLQVFALLAGRFPSRERGSGERLFLLPLPLFLRSTGDFSVRQSRKWLSRGREGKDEDSHATTTMTVIIDFIYGRQQRGAQLQCLIHKSNDGITENSNKLSDGP